jgi:hypothetical protein
LEKGDIASCLGGAIKHSALSQSLLAKLDAAAAALLSHCAAAANIYNTFINQLQAQSRSGVDASAVGITIADAQFLIARCP